MILPLIKMIMKNSYLTTSVMSHKILFCSCCVHTAVTWQTVYHGITASCCVVPLFMLCTSSIYALYHQCISCCGCFTGEFIVGRVIKAMNNSWHPDCFLCEICTAPLADEGFVKNAGRYVTALPFIVEERSTYWLFLGRILLYFYIFM